MDVIDRVPGLGRAGRAPAPGDGRPAARGPRLDARARRGPPRRPRLDLAVLSRILVVNAGSTSLKLSPRRRRRALASRVDGFAAGATRSATASSTAARASASRCVIDDEVEAGDRGALGARAAPQPRRARRRSSRRERRCPDVPHVAVFDTAFHATIPRARRPRTPSRAAGARSGASAATASTASPSPRSRSRCGAGASSSATSAAAARSPPCSTAARVDTTMGFSPLEGVPMATRSGSVDPGALLYLLREHGLSRRRARPRARARVGPRRARRPRRRRSASPSTPTASPRRSPRWPSALGGLDVLAFSGGVGENRPDVRDAVAGAARATSATSASRSSRRARIS